LTAESALYRVKKVSILAMISLGPGRIEPDSSGRRRLMPGVFRFWRRAGGSVAGSLAVPFARARAKRRYNRDLDRTS